jgi:hypothetical protein
MTLRRFTHRTKKDEDRAEEIGSHLDHEQDANAAPGLSPLERRPEARLPFGNFRATRERVLPYRSFLWIEDGWRDLRFAVRSLARTPGFTSTAGCSACAVCDIEMLRRRPGTTTTETPYGTPSTGTDGAVWHRFAKLLDGDARSIAAGSSQLELVRDRESVYRWLW